MKFLILKSKNPHLNLAIEEYLFRKSKDDIFMLWQNDPTVVIGKNQNAFAEINMDYIKENNVYIARRITGGGAVYHDGGNLNYTFISSNSDKEGIDFKYFTAPILDALLACGIKAELSGRNDIIFESKKISGNAQHSENGRVLHHGTLLFDSDLDILSAALKVDQEKLRAKAIKSTRSRVTNLKPYIPSINSVKEFISAIENFVVKKFNPEYIEAPAFEEIADLYKRNASVEWLFPERDFLSEYEIIKKKRFSYGTVEICLTMHNEIISCSRVIGDFFGTKSISEFENFICGKSIEEIAASASKIDINSYISGMTVSDLICLLKE